MRGALAALAYAGALCALAASPLGWIAWQNPDCCSLRSPTLQEAGQGNSGSVPQLDFASAIERIDPAVVDLGFPRTPSLAFVEAVYPQIPVWQENLPMPRVRPAVTQLLLAEAQHSVDKTARQLGVRLDLWCMAAINKWLQHIGVKGTGSDLAVSVKHWGRASKPVPGAIALKPRKGGSGHVVIVKAVKGKMLIAISPNHRGKVREARYPLRVFYAFRAPAA